MKTLFLLKGYLDANIPISGGYRITKMPLEALCGIVDHLDIMLYC